MLVYLNCRICNKLFTAMEGSEAYYKGTCGHCLCKDKRLNNSRKRNKKR